MSVLTTHWTTLGGDPEIILLDEKGKVKTAASVLKKDETRGLEIDGFLAELHPGPVTCREGLLSQYGGCLERLWASVKTKGAKISAQSVVTIPYEVRRTAPVGEVELGCEPDIDAYTGEVKLMKVDGRKVPFRSGGGHMHFGKNTCGSKTLYLRGDKWYLDNTYEDIAQDIIRTMDYLVGIPSILLDDNPNSAKRRELYGKAGSYRIQPHGIEYRVLSNFWLQHPALTSIVYLLGRMSLIVATEWPAFMTKLFKFIPSKDIQDAINENSVDAAREMFPKLFKTFLEPMTDYDISTIIWWFHLHGLKEVLHESILDNWGITKTWWGSRINGFDSFVQAMPADVRDIYDRVRREGKI